MQRRQLMLAGIGLAVAGLIVATIALFLPWIVVTERVRVRRSLSQRVEEITVLNLTGGFWFVVMLCALVAILGTAALGASRTRRIAGIVGPVLALVTTSVALAVVTNFDPGRRGAEVSTGTGAWLGILALPLLGFACGVVAIARGARRGRTPVPSTVIDTGWGRTN